jgi:osmotically-inducible protein OsmY
MPTLNLASAEPVTPDQIPHPRLQELAEGCLRRNPYLALKYVSCDCRGGVLVLRGCLPSYYLKQVAQQLVADLEGVKGVENQIQVVAGASRSGQS